jgi:hypothetical protein
VDHFLLQTFSPYLRNALSYKESDLIYLKNGNFLAKPFFVNFRKLIINNSLDIGSQLPYIKEAQKRGYAVLVLNTNDNTRFNGEDRQVSIPGSSSPSEHAISAWQQVVKQVINCQFKFLFYF